MLYAVVDKAVDHLEMAQRANSPEAENEIRRQAWDLFGLLDGTGAISRSYERVALGAEPGGLLPGGERDRRDASLQASSHLLADAANALAPELRPLFKPVIGDLQGVVLKEDNPVCVRPRDRTKGQRDHALMREYAARGSLMELTQYTAKRDGVTVEAAWGDLVTAMGEDHEYRTLQRWKPPQGLTVRRDLARETGKAVRAGKTLTPEQASLKAELDGLLADKSWLKGVGSVAFVKKKPK